MNFTATVLGTGVAALVLVAKLQAAPEPGASLGAPLLGPGVVTVDPTIVGSVRPSDAKPSAMRLIDLRSGESCKILGGQPSSGAFEPAPLLPDCSSSQISRVSQWRAESDGTLEMADTHGETVMRFMPGDGVLYESVYPSDALVTIVPARG
ncbi:hypothetical protein [Jiella pacifica]|uniref:Protease inhibitor Inh n=1 Tax=Jiella pacifica TaxID=2696469 RepID=A0A6N9T0Q7_9HYPH|nr:hypothetical protein [Jiella pacifica]NDW04910.1 hypothetical protein [Jiella pacifica]